MIYFNDSVILIRSMLETDAAIIHAENVSQGWQSSLQSYERYFQRQLSGEITVFVAECEGRFAGYTTLRPQAKAGPFVGDGLPEVADLNVFTEYRHRGIGSRILDIVEATVAMSSDRISLAVGLHAGYGSAQRLYIKRGYIPDGSGIWYKDRPLEPYTNCCNDDDLVLYLSKQLSR